MAGPPDEDVLDRSTRALVDGIMARLVRASLQRGLLAGGAGCVLMGLVAEAGSHVGFTAEITVAGRLGAIAGVWMLFVSAGLRLRVGRLKRHAWSLWPIYLYPGFMLAVLEFSSPAGMSSYLAGPIPLAWFLVMALSVSLFNPVVTAWVGCLGAVTYLGLFAVFAQPVLRETLAPLRGVDEVLVRDLSSTPIYLLRAAVMIITTWVLVRGVRVSRGIIYEVAAVLARFGMVIDPRVRDLFLAGELRVGGEMREVTVSFADLRGFTALAERTEPAKLLALMREYFDLMDVPIHEHRGTVVEYVGDEVMSLFGAPDDVPDHAEAAGRAALDMTRLLAAQHPKWAAQGFPRLEIGVGLHTGNMMVGFIGSSLRQKYGALGDNVNLGSRLQGLTREFGVTLLASGAWLEQAGGCFRVRPLGDIQVKGRTARVDLYEVRGLAAEPLPAGEEALMAAWEDVLAAQREGTPARLRAALDRCLAIAPSDGPALRLAMLSRGDEAGHGARARA
jgi:class 3 adenylate cyclase